ncbi:MAG: hypothetical protein WBA89_05855 [Microcoleus sp.]|uniref:hypothetical protein n=1 Tax=Microcoleus sp. TaxID=44472 RepID=UPI003C760087
MLSLPIERQQSAVNSQQSTLISQHSSVKKIEDEVIFSRTLPLFTRLRLVSQRSRPIHGLGGTVGAMLTGVFATKAVNAAGNDGLFAGNPGQIVTQFVGVLATYVFAAVGTFVILKMRFQFL